MTPRTDLLALTPDTLAALANRGLVKRAVKELDAGAGLDVSDDGDGTVRGRFPDGTEAVLPAGADLDAGSCTCGAPGLCRHRIGLVLAYRRAAAGDAAGDAAGTVPAVPATAAPDTAAPEVTPQDATPPEHAAPAPAAQDRTAPDRTAPDRAATDRAATDGPAAPGAPAPGAPAPGVPSAAVGDWSPGDVDDEALAALVGARAFAAARRSFDRGYTAHVHRPGDGEPAARVELPTCTVRFPVPGELRHAIVDAAAPLRGEMTALAVWAFRAADARGAREPHAHVEVGGRAVLRPAAAAAFGAAAGVVDELLLEGAVHAGPVLGGSLRRVRAELSAASLHWPAEAAEELAEQVEAYAARDARHHPLRHALLLAELHARHRACASPLATGVEEAGETALRRVRLTALGCRISGSRRTGAPPVGGRPGASPDEGWDRTAEVFLAHADARTVLVLRRRWESPEGPAPTGHALASRRLLGTTLGALATANVVTESASRTASRVVSLARSRIAPMSITPVGDSWSGLPEPLLVRDLGARLHRRDGLPPRPVRPRVAAEDVGVVEVSAVEDVGYDPAEQRLEAVVRDAAGNRALVSAAHNPLAPGALDALTHVLEGRSGEVRFVSGSLRRSGGRIVVEPIAVRTAGTLVVPDLAPDPDPASGEALTPTGITRHPSDPLTEALDTALAALADAAHHGLRHVPPAVRARLEEAAAHLARTGLTTAAGLVRAFLSVLHSRGPSAAVGPWTDAQLHLLVSVELHEEDLGAGGRR
ncbi:hypothetical protein [Streptomyces thermolineatus]|uniref:hypothetical protein n=1 Tax=Streptomyces thermolineatus TaxID=44033 RepID=UPI00384EAF45